MLLHPRYVSCCDGEPTRLPQRWTHHATFRHTDGLPALTSCEVLFEVAACGREAQSHNRAPKPILEQSSSRVRAAARDKRTRADKVAYMPTTRPRLGVSAHKGVVQFRVIVQVHTSIISTRPWFTGTQNLQRVLPRDRPLSTHRISSACKQYTLREGLTNSAVLTLLSHLYTSDAVCNEVWEKHSPPPHDDLHSLLCSPRWMLWWMVPDACCLLGALSKCPSQYLAFERYVLDPTRAALVFLVTVIGYCIFGSAKGENNGSRNGRNSKSAHCLSLPPFPAY